MASKRKAITERSVILRIEHYIDLIKKESGFINRELHKQSLHELIMALEIINDNELIEPEVYRGIMNYYTTVKSAGRV